MRRRLTIGLGLLRAIALGALCILLLNPVRSRPGAAGTPALVLLDASLSMAGANGVWRAALDSARRLAAGGLIWRFGDIVSAFDTSTPGAGQSHLAPALAAAAGRNGPVIVVTDGVLDDIAGIPLDLRLRPRILVLPRPSFFDAFVASVDGPRHVAVGDTIRLRVAYGTAGTRDGGRERRAVLSVVFDARPLLTQRVDLPDSGIVAVELTLPSSLVPRPGLQPLEIRLVGSPDSEPRDDARWFVVDVSPQPGAVVLASPPGWEARFFTKTLADVARVPVKQYVETEPGRWRDAATLTPVPVDAVRRTARAARLVALIGAPDRLASFRRPSGIVWWPLSQETTGDWYVDPAPPSPLTGELAGVAWDSLPPATAVGELPTGSDMTVILMARLARRGATRPLALVRDSAGARTASVAGAGLWRWGFRGGAAAEGYRALVAAVADWLLTGEAGGLERFGPATLETPNGVPLGWRWFARGAPQPVRLTFDSGGAPLTDTLAFDPQGHADLRLPPGVYHWRAQDGPERGVVVSEAYSDEWQPAPGTVAGQPGSSVGLGEDVAARDWWWLFVVALAAFIGEWAWRRRQGLP